jgi:hypothetical protein
MYFHANLLLRASAPNDTAQKESPEGAVKLFCCDERSLYWWHLRDALSRQTYVRSIQFNADEGTLMFQRNVPGGATSRERVEHHSTLPCAGQNAGFQ